MSFCQILAIQHGAGIHHSCGKGVEHSWKEQCARALRLAAYGLTNLGAQMCLPRSFHTHARVTLFLCRIDSACSFHMKNSIQLRLEWTGYLSECTNLNRVMADGNRATQEGVTVLYLVAVYWSIRLTVQSRYTVHYFPPQRLTSN